MDTLDNANLSPIFIMNKLIGLARVADRVGYVQCSEQLLAAAFAVLDAHVSERVMAAGLDVQVSERFKANGHLN